MPINLGEIPDCYRRFLPPIDVACIKVCPKDENGYYTFGGTGLWHPAVMECAQIRVVEVCEHLPRTCNEGCAIHESEVDFIIDGDGSRPAELPETRLTGIDRKVGNLIAAEIEDGACIQVGIGSMPNAACAALLESGAKNLGLHSEMLTDSMVDLVLSGQATGTAKTLDTGRHVYSFALGARKLYDTINDNPDFCCYPA